MPQNYNESCWLCGCNQLEDKGTYVKCPQCGATYNDVPEPSAPCTTPHRDHAAGGVSGSPSGSAIVRRD